jgi:hypothetical protein
MTDPASSSLGYFTYLSRAGSWLQDQFYRHFIVFFIILLVTLAINEISLYGMDISQYDTLLISGALTFIIGIRLAFNIPYRAKEAILRLVNRGAIRLDPKALPEFWRKFEIRSEKYAQWGGAIIGAAVLIGFILAFRLRAQIPLTILEVLGGVVAGQFLGRAVSYGRLGSFLKEERIPIQVQVGHLDKAAGLKPIGDLYFFQAMLVAIPAAFLAVWWLLIPVFPRYSRWRDPYIGLLAITLIIEFLAFLLPIWSFHMEKQRQKTEKLKEADGLSRSIVDLQSRLVEAQTDQDRSELKDRLSLMIERYSAIEQMPTWPVDAKVQRKFTFSNLGLFLPLASYFLNVKTTSGLGIWQEIGKILVSLFQQ